MEKEPRIVKTCSCGRGFTSSQWEQLLHIGTQELAGKLLDYRRCDSCGNTLTHNLLEAKEPGAGVSEKDGVP